jgi:hypothetical protein
MTSSGSDDLRTQVRGLLEGSRLAAVGFVELSMTRKEGQSPSDEVHFPVDIGMGVQPTDEGVAYRVTIGVERPDMSVSVSVVAVYSSDEPSAFRSPDLAQAFGEMIALPAAYPFARAKLHEITVDTGVPPVLLGILDMTRTAVSPTQEDGAAKTDGLALSAARPDDADE